MKAILIKHWLCLFLFLGVLLLPSAPVYSAEPFLQQELEIQEGGSRRFFRRGQGARRPSDFVRDTRDVRSAFTSVVSQPRKSTVEVLSERERIALGTIVDENGYILTKASQLGDDLQCRLSDGRRLDATIVGIHHSTDLAMLKIEDKNLPAIQWSSASTEVGSILATPGLNTIPESIGVASVVPRQIHAPSGILGILLEQDDKGPRIQQVVPDSGAANAGLRVDDIVLGVNGVGTRRREELISIIQGFNPGDQVYLRVARGERSMDVTATLGSRFELTNPDHRADFQNHLGGELSKRRAGFPQALQHDSVLRPEDCGGPLVNLDGKAVGINIARSGRVSSLALPASVVRPLISDLKSGKYAPTFSSALRTWSSSTVVSKENSRSDRFRTTGKAP